MRKLVWVLVLVLVGASGLSANSYTINMVFYSYTDWLNELYALGDLSYGQPPLTEDFDGGELTVPGLTVTTLVGTISEIDDNYLWVDTVGDGATTTWNFGPGMMVQGWGATFTMSPGGPGLQFTPVGYLGPDEYNPVALTYASLSTSTNGFFGFIVDQAYSFNGVTIDSLGSTLSQSYTLDDMVYNPEPSTCLMLGSGLLGFIYVVRRRQKKG